jgi:uncharacterized protein (TIGR02594 family)
MSDDIIKAAFTEKFEPKPAPKPEPKPVEPVITAPLVEARNNGTPEWLTEARKWIGQKEIPGRKHNPWIVSIWKFLGLPFTDDETPWCKGFVSYCLEKHGIKTPPGAMARSFQTWGVKVDRPVLGCVAVFWRGSRKSGAGHVGFVTGTTKSGYIVVLGGNQGDMVSEKSFTTDRLVGYRWPLGVPVPEAALKVGWHLPQLSTKED